jgi:hypothetical protein
MSLTRQQRRAAPERCRRRIGRRRAQPDEKNATGAALSAVEVERFVSGSAKVPALERTGQRSAEALI